MAVKPSIVFAHGIWADGSCFSKVIPPLQAEGYEVMAAQYGLDTNVEDVAATGHVGPGLGLAGTQASGEIGDGGVGMEATRAQFQQTHAPGVGVAMLLGTEEVAVGRSDVSANENGLASLEDFVVGADADGGEVLLGVVLACVDDGLL